MNTLVLVLASRLPPYDALIRTIKETWASRSIADVETLFYYSGDRLERAGNDLTLATSAAFRDMGYRTLACFAYALKHHAFDIVFRTNPSSYVDLVNLREYAARHVTPRFYSGVIGVREIPFASGGGYFLSRELVELVVAQAAHWNHGLPEDRALAALLAHHGVSPSPAPRQQFRTAPRIADVDTSLHHFRCRTTTWRRFEDRRIMLRIHRAFSVHRNLPVVPEPVALRAWGVLYDAARAAHSMTRLARAR